MASKKIPRSKQLFAIQQSMPLENFVVDMEPPSKLVSKPQKASSGIKSRGRYQDYFPASIYASPTGKVTILYPPSDPEVQNKLIEDCIWWCLQDDAILIDQFPLSRCFSPPLFWKISETNEYFAQGEQIARYIIAVRIQERTYSDIYDHNWVSKQLPLYTKEHKTLFDAKISALKSNAGPVTVTMNKIPSSDDVPERKNDK